MSFNPSLGYFGNISAVYNGRKIAQINPPLSDGDSNSSVHKRKLPSVSIPAKRVARDVQSVIRDAGNGDLEEPPGLRESLLQLECSKVRQSFEDNSTLDCQSKFQPFAFAKAPQIYGSYSTVSTTSNSAKWIAKAKKAPDYNVLVVPTPKVTPSEKPAVAINLRRPPNLPSSSKLPPEIHLSLESAPIEIPQYRTTVSTRLGLTPAFSSQIPQNRAAHNEGIGKYLLKKMGWSPGDGIGIRDQPSNLLPLTDQVDMKLDRKGLGVSDGKSKTDLGQMVGYLNNICWDRRWKMPEYVLVEETGPPHAKLFRYKIVFNGMEHVAKEAGNNKKTGKALAAKVCLEALDLV